MPIYPYECSFCTHEFEEIRPISKNSGKAYCPKCGNTAFKIPALFNAKIFKKRKFADGTTTPEFVNTPKQEKDWMKSEGITYDPPTGREKKHIKEERKVKSETALERAFKKASDKVNQGFKLEGLKQRNVKGKVSQLN